MRANLRARNPLVLLAIGFVLAGCAGSGSGPQVDASHSRSRGYYKVGASYQVNGIRYYPKVDYDYDQTGTASWYGEQFNGRMTANGEVFDLTQVSAAHKTLQLPCVVEVTNLKNSRVLQVRVNDRGPYVGDRIIDLSRRASQLLGFEGAGTAPVRVRVLKEESIRVAEAAMRGEIAPIGTAYAARSAPVQVAAAAPVITPVVQAPRVEAQPLAPMPPPIAQPQPVVRAPEPQPAAAPAPPTQTAAATPRRHFPSLISSAQAAEPVRPAAVPHHSGRIFVQAGAFAVPENAQRVRARVATLGSAEVLRANINGAALYRVRVGPFASEADAQRLLSRIVESGYPGARVIAE